MGTGPHRVVLYTHDTFGMGHVRRCMNVIEELALRMPDAAIMLASGSPALRLLEKRPGNVDLLKLPTIAPTGEVGNSPSVLPLPTREIIKLRTRLIKALLRGFEPDLFYVDNFPLGARRELEPVLESLAGDKSKVVLGLRDIIDDPDTIRRRWPKQGVDRVLREAYDRIFVFGERSLFDVVRAYDLEPAIADKIDYCGYAARPGGWERSGDRFAAYGLVDRPKVLVTVGGGGDGLPLIENFAAAMALMPSLSALILTGPLQGKADRRAVEQACSSLGERLYCLPYIEDPRGLMAEADLVISMAGYNTVAELLSCAARMLLVPRDWRFGEHAKGRPAGVEMEQPLRAQMLAEKELAEVLSAEMLTPRSLADAIDRGLRRPRMSTVPFAIDGASRAAGKLCGLLGEMADAA